MLAGTMHLAFSVQLCSETEHLDHIYDAMFSLKEKDGPFPHCGLEGVPGQ